MNKIGCCLKKLVRDHVHCLASELPFRVNELAIVGQAADLAYIRTKFLFKVGY